MKKNKEIIQLFNLSNRKKYNLITNSNDQKQKYNLKLNIKPNIKYIIHFTYKKINHDNWLVRWFYNNNDKSKLCLLCIAEGCDCSEFSRTLDNHTNTIG